MRSGLSTTLSHQLRSRFRSPAYWRGAIVPVVLIGTLLMIMGGASGDPAALMFMAILSMLWIGGSTCVCEVVDERPLIEREPHLPMLGYAIAKIILAGIAGGLHGAIVAGFVRASGIVTLPFIEVWIILVLTGIAGSTLALLLSALCNEPRTALAWFPLLLVPQVVFGGFLFPLAVTQPFALDPLTGPIDMPAALVRRPTDHPAVQLAGRLCVARWALEAYAAQVVEQDLSGPDALREAIRVTSLVPVTLGDSDIPSQLRTQAGRTIARTSGSPAAIDGQSSRYLLVLSAFVIAQALALVIILPARDPRRE